MDDATGTLVIEPSFDTLLLSSLLDVNSLSALNLKQKSLVNFKRDSCIPILLAGRRGDFCASWALSVKSAVSLFGVGIGVGFGVGVGLREQGAATWVGVGFGVGVGLIDLVDGSRETAGGVGALA